MKNKLIFILMIWLAAAPLFAAKPKKEGKISKIKPKTTVVLKVLVPSATDYQAAVDLAAQDLLSKLNVKLELVNSQMQSTGGQMSAINNASTYQNFDLIIQDVTLPAYKTDCQAGAFLDWEENDLLSKWGPNLQNEKKVGIQKNKFFDSPDRRLHGYGLVLTESAAPTYAYKNLLQLCNAVILSHYGYLEFGTGYYNPSDGTYYEKLADDGPYFYTLKFLNALHQNQYKFEDVTPENIESLIKHYEENIDFNEVGKSESEESTSKETSTEESDTTSKSTSVESVDKIKNNYGSNFAWNISSSTEYPELCLAVINQLSITELDLYTDTPVSLYTTAPYPEEVEKVRDKVVKLLEEKTIAAIESADSEAYDAAITDLKTTLSEAGYAACKDFYTAQAQNRFFAEKVAKRTKK